MEQVKGIEPSYRAWEARVLPMNYTCVLLLYYIPESNFMSTELCRDAPYGGSKPTPYCVAQNMHNHCRDRRPRLSTGGHRDPPLRAHQLIFCGAKYIIHRRVYIISHKRYIIRDRRARISLRATRACGVQKNKGIVAEASFRNNPSNLSYITQISSMIAISAASPRRGPILVIRT